MFVCCKLVVDIRRESTYSALRPTVVNPFFVFCGLSQFWVRGKKGGEMLSEGLAPWSLVWRCSKETLFRFI